MRVIKQRKSQELAGLSAVILLAISMSPAAHGATGKSHPMRFGHLTLDDGLSQSNVLSVLQDADGWMWFATENGLNSYDGYQFQHYKRERGNAAALNNDFIFDMVEDKNGSLWLATNGGGLANLDRKSGAVRTYRHDSADDNSISGNVVQELYIDADGIIWIGTRGRGLDRFDPETERFTHIDLGAEVNTGTIFALHPAGDSELWVGGDHGLVKLKTQANSVSGAAYALGPIGEYSVRAILKDSDGQLWVGTFGGGLGAARRRRAGLSNSFATPRTMTATLTGDYVSTIFEDSDGRLWVGTTAGLNLVDRRQWQCRSLRLGQR